MRISKTLAEDNPVFVLCSWPTIESQQQRVWYQLRCNWLLSNEFAAVLNYFHLTCVTVNAKTTTRTVLARRPHYYQVERIYALYNISTYALQTFVCRSNRSRFCTSCSCRFVTSRLFVCNPLPPSTMKAAAANAFPIMIANIIVGITKLVAAVLRRLE